MSLLTDLHGQMNNDFKYILEPYKGPSTRHTCPHCKKKKQFTFYIDQNTGQPLSNIVGLCNRAVNCGYHYTPKQFFQNNKGFNHDFRTNTTKSIHRIKESRKQKPISLIRFEILDKTLKAYDQNFFAQFLVKRLGNKIAEDVAGLYYLGTSKHWKGATVFWQIDVEGRIRSGKVMLYNPDTGKRIKEPFPHINWIHKILKYKNYNLNQCLFGEHLLKIYPEKEIAIVESEKTAMLCAGHIPEVNWLASGNLNNLSEKRIQCLKGKRITLYPDAGAFRIWKDKAEQLKDITSFTVSDLIETRATPEQLKQGFDMADYLTELPIKYTGRNDNGQDYTILTKEEDNANEVGFCVVMNEGKDNDSFFEDLKNAENEKQIEVWPVKELEEFFNYTPLPKEPIQISSSGAIKNVKKYIESNLMVVRKHNGKKIYKPYLDRLIQLKKDLQNN